MIKRSEKLAFMQVTEGENKVFKRMTGFTELSVSKNPKEYSRKYIDEDMERSAVVGYAPAISYKFDVEPGNSVHNVFCNVADRELTGADTECTVVIADISSCDENGKCKAVMRPFSIIPSGEGDDTDTYTCSGSLRAAGEKQFGTATSDDDWQTITFIEE